MTTIWVKTYNTNMLRHIYILAIYLILFSFGTNAQKTLVDTLIPSTVLIKYNSGGSSSGVIVCDSSYLYLVTAKHCLLKEQIDKKINVVDSHALIVYYVDDPYGGKSDTIIVNLASALKNGDLLYDQINDIAILVLSKIIGYTASGNPKFTYTAHTTKLTKMTPGGISSDMIVKFNNVGVGDDCLVIGFPSSLQETSKNDYDFQRPLLRKGAIAGKDKLNQTIIIDCPSYQGNSGGPVFATSLYPNSNIGLIGIVARSILHVEQLESSYYKTIVSFNLNNSGYTVIIPIDFAQSLMKIRRSY